MLSGATEYTSTPVSHDRLVLYINKEIESKIDVDDWSTIKDYPLVSISRSDAWLTGRIARICKNRGITPNIINYYNRAEAAIISVNAGIGIAILPNAFDQFYRLPEVVTVQIPGDDVDIVRVFAWKQAQSTTAYLLFREIALEALLSAK